MKHLSQLLLLMMSFTKLHCFAQLDNSFGGNKNNGNSLGTISAPVTTIKKPTSLDFNNNNGFKTAHKKQQQKERNIALEKAIETKGIFTPKMLAKQRYLKNMEGFRSEIPMIDKDLGSFNTKSKNIHISGADFGQIDGDVISIYRNGVKLFSNYTLGRNTKIFTIPLEIGFNKIEILAIDEGKLRPNTGAFTIYDDYKNVFLSDLWSLAKGAKVIAHIIREK
ncbi:conserved exported hypothetical protein [Tenacibaculum maritimum]|uniref:hypothetical protein n=1 Tax=Tenacibaculum maritimum TaxID=107401 RepID=UPI0012E604B5|nr:hypothetical protein [Tenacibaculum maritimum]CAA0186272.1 conserved exported hypothetical protein [Tenacibaculum maritimum]CAA0189011.1 conserved exported hypothetical protein [Tenacibaculum maritimum]CAA0210772.1 conserved exported hypothetical protein [Tenacibaculum maritimum]